MIIMKEVIVRLQSRSKRMTTAEEILLRKRFSVLVISHRGSYLRAPENTLAAFKLALQEGADGFELDARLTKDGEVVVIHDSTLNRTTSGSGKVGEKTLEEIQALDAGSWFDPKFSEERVPTLREVFESVSSSALINIELKVAGRKKELVERVLEIVQEFKAEHRTFVSSFNPLVLHYSKEIAPHIVTALIRSTIPIRSCYVSLIGLFYTKPDVLVIEFRNFSETTVSKMREKGYTVFSGSVRDEEDMWQLLEWGSLCIFTDDPALLRNVLLN